MTVTPNSGLHATNTRGISDEGSQLTVQDFVRILRNQWILICGILAVVVLGVLAYSLRTTPLYQASTLLFVSTSTDEGNTQTNDGGLFAQRRVVSYIKLLTGKALAERTIDRLGLDMTAAQLQQEVQASSPADTVLIDVTVTDPSPARARDIANGLSQEFAVMAAGLETPPFGFEPNARVIIQQRAELPSSPVTPKLSRNLTIAAVMSLVGATALAVVRDRLDAVIRRPDGIEKVTGVGTIAEIPFDPQRRKDPVIVFGSDHSPVAEAFRRLRVNLEFLEVTDGPRVLVVASSMSGEGRTTTAINLALALAQSGYRVVIVDGDLRRPRVASYLGMPTEAGFSTVLARAATLDEALRETRFAGVSVLLSGAVPPNPSELLESPTTKDVLTSLGDRFDYVIIDSPPLRNADAAILARGSQGVLILARFHRTKRKRLASAMDILRRAGVLVVGCVLTMAPQKDARDI